MTKIAAGLYNDYEKHCFYEDIKSNVNDLLKRSTGFATCFLVKRCLQVLFFLSGNIPPYISLETLHLVSEAAIEGVL